MKNFKMVAEIESGTFKETNTYLYRATPEQLADLRNSLKEGLNLRRGSQLKITVTEY